LDGSSSDAAELLQTTRSHFENKSENPLPADKPGRQAGKDAVIILPLVAAAPEPITGEQGDESARIRRA